ncbi:hypothetical protein BY996DRAFT_6555928 [Phakopsora pachyrhizi]|nr:hypothetical protein BY996DRAFT_6555928 [Phakopsora pachyrhizi]
MSSQSSPLSLAQPMQPDWIFTNVKNPPDIGPLPLTHSNSPPDGTNAFTEVHQYKTPCEHCSKHQRSVRSVFLEGRKVWCNPGIKAYGYEHPIPEVLTSDYNLGIISTLEDFNKMSPRAHIRHLQQAQIAQKTVQIEVRKEVEAFRANKAMAIEENLNEMLDSNEAGRSAHSQSQAWLLDKEVIKPAPAYKLGTQLNDEMGRTFCSLSGWFESLEVEDYEPFDWEDSKGKRKADGCPE